MTIRRQFKEHPDSVLTAFLDDSAGMLTLPDEWVKQLAEWFARPKPTPHARAVRLVERLSKDDLIRVRECQSFSSLIVEVARLVEDAAYRGVDWE